MYTLIQTLDIIPQDVFFWKSRVVETETLCSFFPVCDVLQSEQEAFLVIIRGLVDAPPVVRKALSVIPSGCV